MTAKETIKKYAVWFALFVTLVLTGYLRWHDQENASGNDVVQEVHRDSKTMAKGMPPPALIAMEKILNREPHEAKEDIFAVIKPPEPTTVAVLKPPSPPPAVPHPAVTQPMSAPVPTAPPLPFGYMGKLIEDGKPVVFLSAHGRDLLVRSGDSIDQQYHVDEIGSATMTLTYLPLKIRQTINLGTPN